jgi:hypothetical protein
MLSKFNVLGFYVTTIYNNSDDSVVEIVLSRADVNTVICLPFKEGVVTFNRRPIHLHNLQNIYFALTGNELDVSSLYKKTD